MVAVCFLFALSTFAQQRHLVGNVRDEKGNPVAGASVKIKGSTVGTTTDNNGQFKLTAPDKAKTLEVTYVGMAPKEITIGNETNFSVGLASTTTQLSDVVVIGYGTAKRANLTTAQTSISAKDIEKTVNTTVEQALQGRSPGVYVTQNSGQPGGGMSVNIRGVSTINAGTEPLYVIDGVQFQSSGISFGAQSSSNPLAGINPLDIDNMQVLQGPAASAIYGSRATNGVVIITTKRGKAGDPKLSYNFQYGLQAPPKRLDVMNLQQYAQMVNEFHTIAGGQTQGEFLDPSLLGKGTDWQKEMFSMVPMQKHQISLSGGSDRSNYFMSGEYLNQQGVAIGSGFNRYSFRINLDNKPREWITLGTNFSFNQTNEKLTTSQENVISSALQNTPQIPVKNIDGSWGGGDVTNGANQFAPVNPIAIASLTTNNNKRNQMNGGLNLGLNLFKGLTFRTSVNASIGNSTSQYYVPKYAIGWAVNATARLTEGSSNSTYWGWNQLLEYNRTFGKHTIGAMVGHEAQQSTWKNVSSTRTGFLTNDILDLNAGDPLTATNSGGSGPWALESYFGRLNYNYDNRYILSATIRKDGSPNFGADNRWGTFPSLSAAWRVSKEAWFNSNLISELKLRFETGLTGNMGGGSGIYSSMSTGATPSGTGFLPSQYTNPGLKWEETSTKNFGLNLGLLKDRITIDFDYYIRDTKNLLMQASLPWYMGTTGNGSVAAPQVNLGNLTNKGWGGSINVIAINNKKFRWDFNLNASVNKTVVTKLNSDAAHIDRISWWLNNWTQRVAPGEAPWMFWGYKELGIFQSVDEVNKSAVPSDNNGNRLSTDPNNGVWVGDVKYADISGPNGKPDGIIDSYDLTYIGNPWPKLYGGFTNTFSYAGFDLSIFISGNYGNDIYNYMAAVNTNPNNINLSRNLLTHASNYAKVTTLSGGAVGLSNPGTDVARISYGPNGNYSRLTDKWVEDGSYIKLKNISLSYNFTQSMMSKLKIVKGVKLTVGIQNVATITKYTGYDPEVGSYVGRDAGSYNQAIGLDYGRYPLTPIYTFNLGVNF